ncbi:hypothetical protein TVAG_303020 [Trichomonas vaginalis G3]|uniref:Uncharacterized protein n=1 Tax=Trichomonas vaginalis (strain ATCC PRA-98 / G3) TaxID=412133 RepID=A2FZ02_TRIV3|nr:hypothetical protein TVAGG3_0220240 [Trichomonas vaginalis G3]EAX89865.1 hypothetical protein TVAG_303020 [Trichomonas vaginalis G3]KAI5551873.1 hypothetical protein TVAGG3_0220240 [Trichomonas vaginalis G3]|eukprot:XP_001302795.1 hypothetical protein [Trichomonas vaginalis G3]
MSYNYSQVIDTATHDAHHIFNEFATNPQISVHCFDQGVGLKLRDQINYIFFLDRHLSAQQSLNVGTVFENITKYADYSKRESHKFLLLCLIIDVFTTRDHDSRVEAFWPHFYKLLFEIKDIRSFLLISGTKSISHFLLSNPSRVIDFFDVYEKQRNSNPTIQLLANLKLPKDLSNDQCVAIATKTCSILNVSLQGISMDLIKTALLNILSQIKIENESDIESIVQGPCVFKSPIAKILSSALYITLPNYANAISQRIADFMQFASTSECLKQTFCVIENFFNSIQQLSDDRVEEFTNILTTFVHSIPLTLIQTENARQRAAFFIKHLYDLNKDLARNVIRDYLQKGKISPDILDVIDAYPYDINDIISDDIVVITPTLDNLLKSWDRSFMNEKSISFPHMIAKYCKKATEILKTVERLDDADALKAIVNKQTNKVEDAINNIPFEMLQTMCIVATYYQNPDIRVAAYELLVAVGDMFMSANTDWKDYDQDSQQFIIRFNSDYNYISKRVYGKPRDIKTLLSENEDCRIEAASYMYKKMAGTSHPLAVMVFEKLMSYALKMPYYFEAVMSMYSREISDMMEGNFVESEDLLRLLVENNCLNYIAKMSASGVPLFVPAIDFTMPVDKLAKILRYVTQACVDGVKNYYASTGKQFIEKLLGLFLQRPEITNLDDYAICLGNISQLINLGKAEKTPMLMDIYIIVSTAIQKDVKHQNIQLLEAIYRILLCLAKNSVSTIQTISFLSDTANYQLAFNAISEILKLNESQISQTLVSQLLSTIPIPTIDAILKAKSSIVSESVLFFNVLLSNLEQKSTVSYLNDYMKAKHADMYEEFSNCPNQAEFLIQKFPDYHKAYFNCIEAMRHENPNDVLLLSLLRISTLLLTTISDVEKQSLFVAVKLANKVSQSHLNFTNSARNLWIAVTLTEKRAKLTLKLLFKLEDSQTSINAAFQACGNEIKPSVIKYCVKKLVQLILQERIAIVDLVTMNKIFKLLATTEMTPKLLAFCGIFLFSEIVPLSDTAKKRICSEVEEYDLEYTNIQLLEAILIRFGRDFSTEAKKFAVGLIVKVRDSEYFRSLIFDILISVNLYTSNEFDAQLMLISDAIHGRFTNTNDFDKFFCTLFNVISDVTSVHHIKKEIVSKFMNYSVGYIDFGFVHVNEAIAQMFITLARNGYVDDSNQEFLEEAIKLLFYGDRIYTMLTSSIISKINPELLKTEFARTWLAILNGNGSLGDEKMNKDMVNNLFRASIFGEFIVRKKLSIMFKAKQGNFSTKRDGFIWKYANFLLYSNEVPAQNAEELFLAIKNGFGNVPVLKDPKVPTYKNKTSNSLM